ncbi:hypothetical protein DSO57_1007936 [Entomophthora muscae]|uniref:Uncharacterized protein n=1 Tax=Entomophthora muscae TaxID=34485 RepID=A0ACC2U5K9_9FUNG|nr:hypothetical protein DSO57_1007936 [Entomophthora muscae]
MYSTISKRQLVVNSRYEAWNARYRTDKSQRMVTELNKINAEQRSINRMVNRYNQKIQFPPGRVATRQPRKKIKKNKPRSRKRTTTRKPRQKSSTLTIKAQDPRSPGHKKPTPTTMAKQELEPYRKTFERMLKEDKQDKSICYYLDGKKLNSPAEVKRTYNDSSVILETSDEKNWECELKKTPRDRIFHTDINRCSPLLEGQCVEWADGRYYQLTGFHGFGVDARNWTYMAHLSKDWEVYTKPIYPSIAVYEAKFKGVGSAGHVSIVENITPQNKLCLSSWHSPHKKNLTTTLRTHQPGTVYLRHKQARFFYRT